MNKLPVINNNNIKSILIRGLESKVAELGTLRVPFDFTMDYPSKLSYDVNEDGATPKRKIVIKKLSNTVRLNAIGDNYASETAIEYDEESQGRVFIEYLGQGWLDDYTMEISIWATDSQDRDNIIELIKIWMLELTHRNLEEGVPYFLKNGVISISFQKAYESEDTKILDDSVYFVGIMVYNLSAVTYGTTVEEYERVKFILTNEIQDFEQNPPIVITIPKNPPATGGAAGQETSDILTVKDGAGIPRDTPQPETVTVGGSLRTEGYYTDDIERFTQK